MHKLLSAILVVLIGIPPARAEALLNASNGKTFGESDTVWQYLADQLYDGETDPVVLQEKEQLTSLLFVDYLDYLNAVGIELAAFENSLVGKKDIRDTGECSKE